MRLLDTQSLELVSFPDIPDPLFLPYAILSHTWEYEEVLYEDARHGRARLESCGKYGLKKVLESARIALENRYSLIWIDTLCIDKSSSAELSEAINSMFRWYRRAALCIVFLQDHIQTLRGLSTSRWFTRGWTLQELIAPIDVRFYDFRWNFFGDRETLSDEISKATGIDEELLLAAAFFPLHDRHPCLGRHDNTKEGRNQCGLCAPEVFDKIDKILNSYSISTKMSWVSRRETTRREDKAYCMMGIFNVNMPLLYGEGAKAFRRLQENIVRQYPTDQTILTWWEYRHSKPTIFAETPIHFSDGHLYRPINNEEPYLITISNVGVEVDVHIAECEIITAGNLQPGQRVFIAALNCCLADDDFSSPSIILLKENRADWSFRRLIHDGPDKVSYDTNGYVRRHRRTENHIPASFGDLALKFDPATFTKMRILLHDDEPVVLQHWEWTRRFSLDTKTAQTKNYSIKRVTQSLYKPENWHQWLVVFFDKSNDVAFEHRDAAKSEGFVHAVASVSNTSGDGFFVAWGHSIRVWYSNQFGTQFETEGAFVVVYRCPGAFHLLAGEGLTDKGWLQEISTYFGANALKPHHGCSSITWEGQEGTLTWRPSEEEESIHLEIRINVIKFLGRTMDEIQLSLKVEDDGTSSISSECEILVET